MFDVGANSLVPGGTLRWGQTSVVDTKGNTVTYNWASQDGDVYPDSVEYNGYRVKIYRESRPDPQSFAAASILGRTRYQIRSVLVQNVVPSGSRNSLTKTAGVDGNWDAGAASAQAIASGDGYLEFTASEPWRPVGQVVGLSNGDSDRTPQQTGTASGLALPLVAR